MGIGKSMPSIIEEKPAVAIEMCDLSNQPPNLTINSLGYRPKSSSFAFGAIDFQIILIFLIWFITIYLKISKIPNPFQPLIGCGIFTTGLYLFRSGY